MLIETEGIVLKQVKIMQDRRMILLFTKKYGKISAGSNLSERRKSKASLALRAFTHGRYELYKNKDTYYMNSADAIQSFYGIGEDVDRYMICSYALEFTEKLLPEEQAAPELFDLLIEFLRMMENRTKKYEILLIAYQLKVLQQFGISPQLDSCVICGKKEDEVQFSIPDGGLVCNGCGAKEEQNETLLYHADIGIINIMNFTMKHPLKMLQNLTVEDAAAKNIMNLLKNYISYHLNIDHLKSEGFLNQ